MKRLFLFVTCLSVMFFCVVCLAQNTSDVGFAVASLAMSIVSDDSNSGATKSPEKLKPLNSKQKNKSAVNRITKENFPQFPSPSKPPTIDELKSIQIKLKKR
ncbi:MAG: hypothetical protein LBU65_09870 [Planctomycetaceae bacterium]|nr:hypothetical protein [Planctomycetaceae bacterium]